MKRAWAGLAIVWCVGFAAFAAADEREAPALGAWIGEVSWNDPPVAYAWEIYPDGTFSSGRAGRGLDGAGTWGGEGDHLVLKYADGFRYEGDIVRDMFSGNAYRANGIVFGQFSMWRDNKPTQRIAAEESP